MTYQTILLYSVISVPMKHNVKVAKENVNKCSWSNASYVDIKSYCSYLNVLLNGIDVDSDIFTCTDFHCGTHKQELQ